MADKAKVLGGTAIKPVERHGFDKIKYLIYNKDTGEVLTRTPKSWLLITIFYLIYYTCLACFWAAMLYIFFTTLEPGKPKWVADNGIIGASPGLGLRPMQTEKLIDSSMITYSLSSKTDQKEEPKLAGWGGWADRAKEFLDTYAETNLTACEGAPADGEACKFDVSILGDCAKDGHGYDVGKPCIFLKLNRIYGLTHDYFNDGADLPQLMPEGLKTHIKGQPDKDQVWVDCRPENPADVEGINSISYFPPSRGFPAKYFPYMNQGEYHSPLVAVQFDPKRKGQLLHIECRAWAKNIGYNRRDRIGIVHLEIYVRD